VDISCERNAQWNSNDLPVYEPDLSEIVVVCRKRNLFFDTDIEKGFKESEIILVSVLIEFTILELAEKVIELTGSRSGIVLSRFCLMIRGKNSLI